MEIVELHRELSEAEHRYTNSIAAENIKSNLIKRLKRQIKEHEKAIELYVKYIMRKREQLRVILGQEPSKRTLHNVSIDEYKIIYSHLIK